jgi:hypothetical protein
MTVLRDRAAPLSLVAQGAQTANNLRSNHSPLAPET